MSWVTGNQKIKKEVVDLNQELLKIQGELPDDEAKRTLAKFLRSNLRFSTELLLGIQLEPYQEVTLKGFFNRNFNMLVWSRGAGKSFVAAVFCILQCIFEPGTKIIIASANFRTSRRIFGEVERLLARPEAGLARQCFAKPVKRNDEFYLNVAAPSSGSITAIPLGGEKVRGFRASVLIVDEFLLMPREIVDDVLMPFLSSPLDVEERIKIREIEKDLIKQGRLKEEDMMKFENKSKMLTLSSASYTFEYLFELYQLYCGVIDNPDVLEDEKFEADETKKVFKDATYFVSQLSYEALPEHMVDQAAVQMAKSGGTSMNSFLREYGARFIDGGDGFYSPKKMNACTIPDGEYPTTKVLGDKDKKYILAIDPNVSSSKSADFFAMSILELDEELKQAYYVHGYQKAGVSVKDHIKYFYYLLEMFKPCMIIADAAGAEQFIEASNESQLFKQKNKKIKFVYSYDPDKEGEQYDEMLAEVKKEYNPETGHLAFKQQFSSMWLRSSNEYLQSCIDHKKIWFASRACAHPDIFENLFGMNLPLNLVYPSGIEDGADDAEETTKIGIRDFVELQDHIISDTKDQCALIQVSSTAKGTQSFDLPLHLRRSNSANKARKDNYTALLLATWGMRFYFELSNTAVKKKSGGFVPFFLG
jgi:hypothetical protein